MTFRMLPKVVLSKEGAAVGGTGAGAPARRPDRSRKCARPSRRRRGRAGTPRLGGASSCSPCRAAVASRGI
eukprot:scaffold10011_cov97-Isochrysis_galbana.AAC.6